MHLYKYFSACRYIALTAGVKFCIGSPKMLRMNKFVRTKSHIGSKFFQNIFGAFVHVMDCSCALILQFFSSASDGATANCQIPNCIFGQLFTSLRKDSVTNYASIRTAFSPTVTGLDVLYKSLNDSS